jgi:hemoglobin-like flavoprotein
VTLHESVDRVLAEGTTLTDRFYEIFFERHPAARNLFAGTHMRGQSVMLSAALMVAKHHPDYPLATREYLNVLGTRHARKHVPRELYPAFVEILLVALEEFHATDWDDGLAGQWRDAITEAVELMFEGYDRRAHV